MIAPVDVEDDGVDPVRLQGGDNRRGDRLGVSLTPPVGTGVDVADGPDPLAAVDDVGAAGGDECSLGISAPEEDAVRQLIRLIISSLISPILVRRQNSLRSGQ